MNENWICWLYQYVVGGLAFFLTLATAARAGAIRWSHRTERRLVIVLVTGYVAFLAVHALWILETE